MSEQLMTITEVQALTKLGKSSIFNRSKPEKALLPPPIKNGRRVHWLKPEVEAAMAAIAAGQTDDEIRALVRNLVQGRKAIAEKLADLARGVQ